MTGASADGIAEFVVDKAVPRMLRAQFIIVASAEAYNTMFPGGAYRQALVEHWLNGTLPKQGPGLINFTKTQEADGPWWDAVDIVGPNSGPS